MKGETQDEPEKSSQGLVWVWLCWLAAIAVLYVLSSGPVVMVVNRTRIPPASPAYQFSMIVYWPLARAYMGTPLHKPIGLYWHLWAPDWYKSNGDINMPKSVFENSITAFRDVRA